MSCISRPVRRAANQRVIGDQDLCYVPGGEQNALLVALGENTMRVLDFETGQWSTWKTGTSDPGDGL